MPRKKRRRGGKDDANRPAGRRPVWSGTLAFGLVTMPVELYSTVSGGSSGLRMIGPDGAPLSRRYYSERSRELLEDEDIVRGYEVAEGEFVLIEDEELEALDPDRSRTIELEMFVPHGQIDPLLVNSSYLVIPREEATAAYRLLVASMADSGQAGIARFVLRDRTYQVALVSVQGTLRALTLRYPDELRSPEDVGLPEPEPADLDDIEALAGAMKKLETEELDPELLEDDSARRLEQLVVRKLKDNEDVLEPPAADDDDSETDDSGIDLLEQLRRSLDSGSGLEA